MTFIDNREQEHHQVRWHPVHNCCEWDEGWLHNFWNIEPSNGIDWDRKGTDDQEQAEEYEKL